MVGSKRSYESGAGGSWSRAAADERQGAGAKRPYDRGGGGPENAGAATECVDFKSSGRCEYKAKNGSACRFAHTGGVWDTGGRSGVVVDGSKRRSGDKAGGDGRRGGRGDETEE